MTNNTNSVLAKQYGVGVVKDDDGGNAPPAVTIPDVVKNEGTGTATGFEFQLSLSAVSGDHRGIPGRHGTATVADADFEAVPVTVTFAPGQTTQSIVVPVTADARNERAEFFQVFLSNPLNAVIAKSQGAGVILNDDANPAVPV